MVDNPINVNVKDIVSNHTKRKLVKINMNIRFSLPLVLILLFLVISCSDSSKPGSRLTIAHNLKYSVTNTDIVKVKLRFMNLINPDGKRIRQVQIPERNTNYSIDISPQVSNPIHYYWVMQGRNQTHVFKDSTNYHPVDNYRIASGRTINPVSISDHFPLIADLNTVKHRLEIINPNKHPIKPSFLRVIYNQSGRLLEKRILPCENTIPADTTIQIILRDYLNPDLLSESCMVLLDTVKYLN